MEHELKCHPEYFQAVKSGAKTFEKRKADRPYSLGDTLFLREWDLNPGEYTGDSIRVGPVTYILGENALFGEPGTVIMGFPNPTQHETPPEGCVASNGIGVGVLSMMLGELAGELGVKANHPAMVSEIRRLRSRLASIEGEA